MIKLKPFGKKDFDKLISWIDDEELLVQFAGPLFTFPLTRQQLEEYLEDEKRLVYKVMLLSTGETIGHAEIYLPEKKLTILCRILIGDPAQRGKGLGKQIINKLLGISFNQLHAEKVELNVFDWNIAAIKCYENAGLVINPRKTKKRQVKDQTWTALNMGIDKDRWR